MNAMIISELSDYWRRKELEWGRIITINEVAKETKLDWETVNNLKAGTTKRFDSHVIGKICDFFGIKEGETVPFLVLRYREVQKKKPTAS